LRAWERMSKVFREQINDLCAPSFMLLAGQNLLPNPPIEENEFAVHCKGGPNLGGADSVLQQREEILVALRTDDEIGHIHLRSYQIAGVESRVVREFADLSHFVGMGAM